MKPSTTVTTIILLSPIIEGRKTKRTHICANTSTRIPMPAHCRSDEPWTLIAICATGEPKKEELSCPFYYTWFRNEYHFYEWATEENGANVPCQIKDAGDGGVGHYACVYVNDP